MTNTTGFDLYVEPTEQNKQNKNKLTGTKNRSDQWLPEGKGVGGVDERGESVTCRVMDSN